MWTAIIVVIFMVLIVVMSLLWYACWEKAEDDARESKELAGSLDWYKETLQRVEGERDYWSKARDIEVKEHNVTRKRVCELENSLQTSAEKSNAWHEQTRKANVELQNALATISRITLEKSNLAASVAELETLRTNQERTIKQLQQRDAQRDVDFRRLNQESAQLDTDLARANNRMKELETELYKYATLVSTTPLQTRPIEAQTVSEVTLSGFSAYDWMVFSRSGTSRDITVLARNLHEARTQIDAFCVKNNFVLTNKPEFASLWPKCKKARLVIDSVVPLSVILAFGSHVNCALKQQEETAQANASGPTDSAS